ncbi:chromate efflux transporter [bacterium]|nr:chromate efflux transporter [bacterium]
MPTNERQHAPAPVAVPFATAFRFWVKLGFISFGGPAGQIAIMHREIVERRRWLSEERFLHALNYCMLLPGPEAQQLAIYIGWLLHRTLGGIVAGAFFVIPSIFVLLALSYVYAAYGELAAVAGVLAGFKPVVVAIVVDAVLKIGGRALRRRVHYAIAAAAFLAIYVLHLPFPLIVLLAAGVGLVGARRWPDAFAAAPVGAAAAASARAAPSCDVDAASAPHTRPSSARFARVLAIGVALWLLPFLALIATRGWTSVHAHEYRFFTLAAFVTFGGAYSVLAYVTQVATTSFGWLTHAQAVDGLALAETTPGPLIMVLQFVGFMAGWNNPQGMTPLASAVTGALLTTYATFLPCFLFIFLGAPYVEVIRGDRRLTAALSGVTAAVVGVVLNLALVFGAAVVWPHGPLGGTEWPAVLLGAVAFALLHRYRVDVLWIVLGGGLVGLALHLRGAV